MAAVTHVNGQEDPLQDYVNEQMLLPADLRECDAAGLSDTV